MPNITLNNGIRSLTLDWVLKYNITKSTDYPVHKVLNRETPTVDEKSKTTTPRVYQLQARMTATDMLTLLSMESDREVIAFNDNAGISDPCCFLTKPEPQFVVGRNTDGTEGSRPWLVNISLLSSAN